MEARHSRDVSGFTRVSDGTRTRDRMDHNQELRAATGNVPNRLRAGTQPPTALASLDAVPSGVELPRRAS